MIDLPPGFLPLRSPDASPVGGRTGVRVDAMKPAALDGEAWLLGVLRVARDLGQREGSLTPSRLRERCATLGLNPPHPNLWGSAWARLRSDGWTRLGETTSTTTTRNAARESRWAPPGGVDA